MAEPSSPAPSPDPVAAAEDELPAAERERLVGRYGRRFVVGDNLFREGDPADEAFLLQEGRVRLLKRVRLVEKSLVVLKSGDLFGESALLDPSPRNSTAVALSDGLAVVLNRTTFRPMLENYPKIAIRLLEQLTRRIRDAEDQIEIMMVDDTNSKIVASLLKLAQPATSGQVELFVSPVDLSTRVGLDVDTVKSGVKRLREQGYLRIVGERVEIPDLEALRRLYLLLGTKEELRGEPPGR
jgi:CRP/FNR family cyclic AMP-dependent transcriptional regulator